MDEKFKKVNVGFSGLIYFLMFSLFLIEELVNIYKVIV